MTSGTDATRVTALPDLDPHAAPDGVLAVDGAPPRSRVLRRLAGQPATLAAGLFLAVVVASALLAPLLAPHDPLAQDLSRALEGPSGDHWLGTDHLGRDALSRLIYGARVALQASLQTVSLAMLVGVPLGLFVAYRSGWWDRVLMRLLDVADAVPGLVLAFAVIAVLGSGLTNAMIAVGLIFAINYMRLSRALALGEREKLYVDAAQVSGLTQRNIMLRQMLPNLAGPLIVQSTIYMGTALLIEAALSFLGLGLDISQASWGGMLSGATTWQGKQPFLPWPPGLAITLTVLAYNVLGDGLRDALLGEQSIRSSRARRRLATLASNETTTPQLGQVDQLDADGQSDQVLVMDRVEVSFPTDHGLVTVVDGVSLSLRAGETLGLVGESGSGKSLTGLAAMGLVPVPGAVTGGSVRVCGRESQGLSEAELARFRGSEIAMIFQDPLVALSPVHTIGRHLRQAIRNHSPELGKAAVEARAIELLETVGIAGPASRLNDYPHQFSGGMAQRVVIAIALAGNPRVLIADEPTTALDVTTQQQVLDLLADLRERFGMAIVLITHDFGVIADSCDRAAVMYAGQIVEEGTVDDLFSRPRHPYTSALLSAMPVNAQGHGRLPTIEGRVPAMDSLPAGCRFADRCQFVEDACRRDRIPETDGVLCLRHHELDLRR